MFKHGSKPRTLVIAIKVALAATLMLSLLQVNPIGGTATAAVSAQAGADEPSKGVIKVGGVCSVTGLIYYGAGCHSADAYFKYINKKGGVNGYTFDYTFYDDGMNQAKNESSYRRLVEEDKVLAIVGSVQNLSFGPGAEYLEDQQVPLIGPGYASPEENRPNVYPLSMWVADYGGQTTSYFVEKLDARHMCIVYANLFPARVAVRQTKYVLKQMKHPEYLQATLPVSIAEPDYNTIVIRLKNEGCDSILTFIDPASTARFLQAANQQAFNVPIVIPHGAWEPGLADTAGSAGNGALAQVAWDLPQTGTKEAKLYGRQLEKYYPDEEINAFAPGGWVAAKAFVEAVRRIKGDPTREKLVTALLSMKGWKSGLAPAIDVGTKPPTQSARFYVLEDGEWKPETKFLKAPPLCPDCLTNDDVDNIP